MNDWKIEEHDRSEDEKIFDLQQLVYPKHRIYKDRQLTRKYWQWRYFSHPEIQSQVYVVKSETNGLIVGMRPVTFLPLQINKKKVLSVWLTAVITHPEFRRQGIFSSLVRYSLQAAQKHGAKFAFTFPNEQSYAVYKKKPEWHYLGAMPMFVNPIKPWEISTQRMPSEPIDEWTPKLLQADLSQVRIQRTEIIDDAFDHLWQRAGQYRLIAVKRDADYLRWRYQTNPVNSYTIIEARNQMNDMLKGYVIATIQTRSRLSLGLIIDILVEDKDVQISRLLIKQATNLFKKRKVAVAACLMNRKLSYARSLVRCGYLPVYNWMNPKKFHVICSPMTNDPILAEMITDFDNWFLTWGDTDNV